MTSVPFCNLNDIYGPNGLNINQETENNKMKRSFDNLNYFPEDINKFRDSEKMKNEIKNELLKEFPFPALNNIKDLPTFKNAVSCNQRNNQFQNNNAKEVLRVEPNPLNNSSVIEQEKWPYYNPEMTGYPPSVVPVRQNMWPQQLWYGNGPAMPYDAFNPYNMRYRLDIPSSGIEHFEKPSSTTMNSVLAFLAFLFVVQLVDLTL